MKKNNFSQPQHRESEPLVHTKKSALKTSFYFKEYTKRFQNDPNCNHRLFGYDPVRTDSFDAYKIDLANKDRQYNFDLNPLQYSQQEMMPLQKKRELQNVVKTQNKFKIDKDQYNLHSRQLRIMQNLHRDPQSPIVRQNQEYYIFQNTNRNIEFSNNDIQPKNNSYYELSKDWNHKKQVPQLKQENLKQSNTNDYRQNYLRFQDTRGRQFNALNFTQI